MRECTGASLNDMMVHYDRAVAKQEAQPTDDEAAQQAFDDLRDEVIRPLMAAFGEVLEAHGHHCRVYDKPVSVTTPGNLTQNAEIIMHILPKEGAVPALARKGYRLSFLLAEEHRKLLARMTHGRWEESCSSCPHDLHPLEGVTAELIEAELLEMMQHVFADARPTSPSTSAVPRGRQPNARSMLTSHRRDVRPTYIRSNVPASPTPPPGSPASSRYAPAFRACRHSARSLQALDGARRSFRRAAEATEGMPRASLQL